MDVELTELAIVFMKILETNIDGLTNFFPPTTCSTTLNPQYSLRQGGSLEN
jgi:hypothetical protein